MLFASSGPAKLEIFTSAAALSFAASTAALSFSFRSSALRRRHKLATALTCKPDNMYVINGPASCLRLQHFLEIGGHAALLVTVPKEEVGAHALRVDSASFAQAAGAETSAGMSTSAVRRECTTVAAGRADSAG